MNFCPYPVEPWKLIMMTTYPLAAKSSGFQRYDQSSPHAPCGPPWMRNFTGYFLVGSKFGGLTRKPWTLSPCAPGNQKVSRGGMETWERTALFRWLSCLGGGGGRSPHSRHSQNAEISFGAFNDISVKTRFSPSGVTERSSCA